MNIPHLFIVLLLKLCVTDDLKETTGENGNLRQMEESSREDEYSQSKNQTDIFINGLSSLHSSSTTEIPSPTKPNVILLLVDDLGYGDLGISGHPTSRTPNIDHLANNGNFFTQFYVTSPICSPSRAAFLTGRYPVRSGIYPGVFHPDSELGLPENETTLSKILHDIGYKTHIVGKWHLGTGRNGEFLPVNFGFEDYFGIPYSHDMCPCKNCFPGELPCYDLCWTHDVSCPLFSNKTIIEQPAVLPTLTERLLESAASFISTSVSSQRPFFLYFAFHHVHHPQFASSRWVGTSPRGSMGDALSEMDWVVGEIKKLLVRNNILDSTLIWFASDNGPSLTRHERGGSAGLLRCGKGTTWEGGVRVPSFVHWPERVKPGRTNELITSLDILPTTASIVGADISNLTLDGLDVTDVVVSRHEKGPREFYAIYPIDPTPSLGPYAVIHGAYKVHFYTEGSDLSDAENYDPMCPASHHLTKHDPPLLYHLQNDPGERYNLGRNPKYRELIQNITSWRKLHMETITWMPPRTSRTDPRAQPCCTNSSCEPFPECCDCP